MVKTLGQATLYPSGALFDKRLENEDIRVLATLCACREGQIVCISDRQLASIVPMMTSDQLAASIRRLTESNWIERMPYENHDLTRYRFPYQFPDPC